MERSEVIQQLEKVFYWMDKISVCGAAVDVMAMARRELRVAQAMLQKEDEKTEG